MLVVDHDGKSGALLREALERAGYPVALAHDREQGFVRVLAGGIDLVVLHQRAVDAAAFAWCRRLAARTPGRYLPVIVLAERACAPTPAAGRATGVAACLAWPVDVPELLRQVRVWTEAREQLRTFYARLLRAAEGSTETHCA